MPVFSLDAGSVVVALTLGVSAWVAFQLLWMAGRWVKEAVAVRMMAKPPRLR